MSAYVLTALARSDIFRIWSYIAVDNEDAADRVEPFTMLANLLQKIRCAAVFDPNSRRAAFASGL